MTVRYPGQGSSAIDVILWLCDRHSEISTLSYILPDNLADSHQRAIAPKDEQSAVRFALDQREQIGLPFWDGILLFCVQHRKLVPELLKQSAQHNTFVGVERTINRPEFTKGQLITLIRATDPSKMLALSSRVRLQNGEERHFAMLDFRCPSAPDMLHPVVHICKQIGLQSGFVIDSGNSYHVYGTELLTNQQLIRFLGTALLFAPIVDRPWVAHQLIEGACALRISPRRGSDLNVVALIT